MGTAYQKARREVMQAHGFERYSAARPPYTARHREYLRRGAELTARGGSAKDEVRVKTVGLIDFEVRIAADVLDRHDEREFMLLANSAMNDLQATYKQVLANLLHELSLKYQDKER